MQISASAIMKQTLVADPESGDGPIYDLPRGLVLALNGAAEAQEQAIAHLYATGQVQPGDVIAVNWPAP